MTPVDCFVCAARCEQVPSLPWYDVPVHRVRRGGVTLVGVGAIVPGYLLACPEPHVRSLAALPRSMVDPFLSLVDVAVADLTREFASVLLFEHGGCNAAVHTSACIDHAHLHLWAIAGHVTLTLPRYWQTYPDLRAFLGDPRRAELRSYLLHSDQGGSIMVGPDVRTPQFFRRQVAAQLGHPDAWDYAACPFEQCMRDTRDKLTGAVGHHHAG
ncbi:hypothetical protein OOK41_17150 [Micromonospora sp. NBC_01655]|uniref:hypothetical protein n=1 Tax=Micromonospora sp. NBC_01655 TaxID=2975983 RepID=UPI00225BBDED|nr:hypothetical protein [Micromonospora sp. NBC_01655]MCX4472014.1 hypothetical protein [Micromonospora sp. NBC_01655]